MSENSPRTLRTVERTCRVLEAVRRSGEVGITNLAERSERRGGRCRLGQVQLRGGWPRVDGAVVQKRQRFIELRGVGRRGVQ